MYDEGPLNARPHEWGIGDEGQQALQYNIGENAYLDPDFLKAMGEMDDRGLAAEGLRLVQLDGEFRHLKHWEKKLAERERANTIEQGELIRRQNAAVTKQKEVYERLQSAKAAGRLGRWLPYRNGCPGLSLTTPIQPYSRPTEEDRRQPPRGCYWCEERSMLYGHRSWDCQHPHIRCARLSKGRCLVPPHHADYCSYIINPGECPYNGENGGVVLRGDHA